MVQIPLFYLTSDKLDRLDKILLSIEETRKEQAPLALPTSFPIFLLIEVLYDTGVPDDSVLRRNKIFLPGLGAEHN